MDPGLALAIIIRLITMSFPVSTHRTNSEMRYRPIMVDAARGASSVRSFGRERFGSSSMRASPSQPLPGIWT
jgi:hypothetical protein